MLIEIVLELAQRDSNYNWLEPPVCPLPVLQTARVSKPSGEVVAVERDQCVMNYVVADTPKFSKKEKHQTFMSDQLS